MTISTSQSSVTLQGNGATTVWTFPFVAGVAANIVVILVTAGVSTILNPNQYSVSLNAVTPNNIWGVGGTVTYPLTGSPIALGTSITIERIVPLTQLVSILNQSDFNAQVVEQALDQLEMQIQQIAVGVSPLAVQAPIVDVNPQMVLPPAAQRAGQFLGFDSNGNVIAALPSTGVPISSAMQPVVESSTVAAAFALLSPFYSAYQPFIAGPNRLVNPLMIFDQRNEGSSVTLSSGTSRFMTDQWAVSFTQTGAAGTTSAQRVADAPVALGGGNGNSLKFTMGTGHATSSGDFGFFLQNIEALNTADLAFGSASAQPISVSFWMKSSLANPVFTLSLSNSAANRSYLANFALGAANTWQHVTIQNIPGDVTGTWLQNTNGVGLALAISFGAGATFQGTNNAWQASQVFVTNTTTNLMNTTGATVQITGLQVEVGPFCTALQARQIAQELALCQRYYEKSFDIGTALGTATNNGASQLAYSLSSAISGAAVLQAVTYKTTKRASATIIAYSPGTGTQGKARDEIAPADVTPSQNSSGLTGFTWSALAAGSAATANIALHWVADVGL